MSPMPIEIRTMHLGKGPAQFYFIGTRPRYCVDKFQAVVHSEMG